MENSTVQWEQMSPEQRRAFRLEKFRNSGDTVNFVSDAARKAYDIRVQRLVDVYNVRQPDRVPLDMMIGNLPLTMAGLDMYSAFYEIEKSSEAIMEFNRNYCERIETFAFPMGAAGEVMDILDYRLYAWPGHGLPKTASGWQFIEGEYMTVDEYDDLIRDPSDFWLRKYLPRVFGSFEPFRNFEALTNIVENPHVSILAPFAKPQVMDMFQTFIEAGKAFQRYHDSLTKCKVTGAEWGFPSARRLFCTAPFDTLGDTLRGTTNIMKDMFRRPDKLLKALDVIADITIRNILSSPDAGENTLLVTFPLHKGADGWMSQAQYEKFYWPSLKKVMDAFIDEGYIQSLFAEGSYETRLDYVNQFPRGSVAWWFDRTDMAKAKKALGKDCAIMGNIPSSLLVTGEPPAVKEYCRQLIEDCAPGGGYILRPGAVPEYPKLENLITIAEAANEYGYY